MRILLLICITLFSFQTQAQLVFENNSSAASTPKFVVNTTHNTTHFYAKVGGTAKLFYTWNKIPQLFDDTNRTNRYKMVVVEKDKVAKRTFEIHYSLYRETQSYTGYIKQTIDYHDSTPTKVIEDHFRVK